MPSLLQTILFFCFQPCVVILIVMKIRWLSSAKHVSKPAGSLNHRFSFLFPFHFVPFQLCSMQAFLKAELRDASQILRFFSLSYPATGETWYSILFGTFTRCDASRISSETRLPLSS